METRDDLHEATAGEQLLARARALRAIVRAQARRAFVLELTGTPKAGKSTSVVTLQTFFKEAGFQVHLLRERAADCPLPMKGHFFFNAWTTATMLAEVLETHETPVDILILDRGFFDALVWLELQARRGQVNDAEKDAFSNFVLLDRWRSLVDATVVMTVSPEVALKREHQHQIVRREGSMMNPQSLAEFNEALAHVAAQHGHRFLLEQIDTTAAGDVVRTNIRLLERLLPIIEAWADPEIAVAPKEAVERLFEDKPFLHGDEARQVLSELSKVVSFQRRSRAEQDLEVVQFTAAGVHTHRERVVVLERELRDKKAEEYGRRTLWIGCHVDRRESDLLSSARQCLIQRIHQELHLAQPPELELLGLAWDRTQRETQHVGIMFRAPLQSDHVASHLKDKQFKKMGRSGRLRSLFMTQEEIVTALDELELEPWSRHMARNIKLAKDA